MKELGLVTLEERRQRGYLIALFRIQKGMEMIDREYLTIRDVSDRRGHSKKLKKRACRRDYKKYSFPHGSITVWNKLNDEIACAKTLHEFKTKLDERMYRDGTARAQVWLFSCILQLGKTR